MTTSLDPRTAGARSRHSTRLALRAAALAAVVALTVAACGQGGSGAGGSGDGQDGDLGQSVSSKPGASTAPAPRPDSMAFSISGRVTDSGDEPVADALIVVTSKTVGVPEIAVLTGKDGTFTWPTLPAGAYTIHAQTTDGAMSAKKQVEVTTSEPTKVTLVLK